MRTLITGGVRSGKSFQAESLVVGAPDVTYIAPGPPPDPEFDPDWAARVRAHRERRPEHWKTIETSDLEQAIAMADTPVIIDCLGTWVTSLIDELDGWDQTLDEWEPLLWKRVEDAISAMTAHAEDVVVVTNEVGWGVVPETRSGRLFRDLLGTVNQRFADDCDEVLLVVSGRVLRL
ncbi:bifunctional adenosylcobinamide kinase/adenosylcobinamide-phosphate guanylyltransferase [Aeromicrobium duanguangcaii]|uniref:Adenosylcobinamide kinase n=1 Tax=Aeromicrobium duanguangcaii TaxID=2968086 RepID=A0ABY5KIM8_9ACTN|nr:bifunctional adenosylcobinamide kinase/adenosylcobinamide-phosphate guanylyltransferase [Aeromicrobium duanguangcaii]MCD9155133.1 bifunctional adenosylcobinamide kinase/adenosylcobinamide-phosphate guanylyltransferase [Aeromicrobium duanguangcaii]MCL3838479.1 bifunctional adenosylcobinamide kinase/adenosylcobinamide-phosphate guanylyltransferase [Aeromicrobium duanguangcaii]UUI68213.1 bifunctional adenosylcobinamide kinase/adenosylcobinamide-phosphate guanylyltransferase [Aeromicrobium duangu